MDHDLVAPSRVALCYTRYSIDHKTVRIMSASCSTPVVGFAAFSGTGKTTLLCRLIPLLRARGLRLGLIKHSHHAFEIDRPGKDSFRLRQAGAARVVVASTRLRAVISQHPPPGRLALDDFLRRLDDPALDLLLVEGYKYYPIPKIEVHRPSLGHPLLASDDPDIIAVASDAPVAVAVAVPVLDINDPAAIAGFIIDRFLSSARIAARA